MQRSTLSKAAAAGAALVTITLGAKVAGAQTGTTVPASGSGTTAAANARPDRKAALQAVLAPLVSKGTITQAQADAVVAAIDAAGPVGGGRGGHGPGGMGGTGGPGGFANSPHLDAAAKALGMTPADLKTAVSGGKTLAQVATEKGVDVNKVIAAIVAEEKVEHPGVADADLTARVTAMVNGTRPQGGPMGGRGSRGTASGTTGATQGTVTASTVKA